MIRKVKRNLQSEEMAGDGMDWESHAFPHKPLISTYFYYRTGDTLAGGSPHVK